MIVQKNVDLVEEATGNVSSSWMSRKGESLESNTRKKLKRFFI